MEKTTDRRPERQPLRVEPQAGATRCPFCHEDCPPEADVAVCRSCLSRHHAACWQEGATCASCGASQCLTPTGEASQTAGATGWLGMTRRELGLWVVLIGVSALILGLLRVIGRFEQMFEETGIAVPALTELVLTPARYPTLTTLAVIAWVATAALAHKRRRGFVAVVLVGLILSVPAVVLGLFLPLVSLL